MPHVIGFPERATMLVVGTIELPESDYPLLDDPATPCLVGRHPEGYASTFRTRCNSEDPATVCAAFRAAGLSARFIELWTAACEQGAQYLMFDRDADGVVTPGSDAAAS